MNNRGEERRFEDRRASIDRRKENIPVANDRRSGVVRRDSADRRSGDDRRQD